MNHFRTSFILASFCLLNCQLSFSAKPDQQITVIEPEIIERIEVDSIWAANGVGFDLKTVGYQQFVVYYDVGFPQLRAARNRSDGIHSCEW